MSTSTIERPALRHGRDTPEFARVVNLSDAVFAIAMTLLVLTLDIPEVAGERLVDALADRVPQLIAFILGFGLVANIWWAHHKLLSRLRFLDSGLTAINLAMLGAVALVPFPTALVGNAPTARAAVVPFVVLFVVLLVLFTLLIARAQATAAWRQPIPPDLFPWVLGSYVLSIAGMLLALAVAVWIPVAGLVIAGTNGTTIGVLMALLAPPAYRAWAWF